MPFKFEIKDAQPIYMKGVVRLGGQLLEGEIRQNDTIGVSLENGSIVPGRIVDIGVDLNKRFGEVTAEQGKEFVSIAVSRLSEWQMAHVRVGVVTEWVTPPADINGVPFNVSTAPVNSPKPLGKWKSAWRLFRED